VRTAISAARSPLRAPAFATVALSAACPNFDRSPNGPAVEISYMVDTASAEHKEVLDLWRSYMASRPQDFTKKPQWSEAEQKRWKLYDLVAASSGRATRQSPRPAPRFSRLPPPRPATVPST